MDQVVGDSLALVNVVRSAFGKEPLTELPDAYRGNSSDCLYYRAFADIGVQSVGGADINWKDERTAAVVAGLWGVERHGTRTYTPHQIHAVIGAFDGSELDQYNL